jgi:hypothetical protein
MDDHFQTDIVKKTAQWLGFVKAVAMLTELT